MNSLEREAILASLEKLPKTFLTFFAFLLVLVIGWLDFITSPDVAVVLYLLPVILVAWFEGGVPAAVISIFSVVTWAVADLASEHIYLQGNIAIWNALMRLTLFLIVSYFMVFIKKHRKENGATKDGK
jgi:K+-sensing histidine kinase KdpD